MALSDIFKLRPSEPTANAIRQALDRAIAAEQTENAELQRLETERNNLLLDGSASALSRAESALTEARSSAGRVANMRVQLEQRLAATIEAEAVAKADRLRKEAEAAAMAERNWWYGVREQLAATLREGMRLRDAHANAHGMWSSVAMATRQQHPGLELPPPASPADHPGTWLYDLAYRARVADFSDLDRLPLPASKVVPMAEQSEAAEAA